MDDSVQCLTSARKKGGFLTQPTRRIHRMIRWAGLHVLRLFGRRDITIRHHYTGERLSLNAFCHKGYWFHGRDRESETMTRFSQIIEEGDLIVEVGGHIGYISQYLSSLVGQSGKLVVFEPGPNNLPYIKRNVGGKENVQLVEMAASDQNGKIKFYLEGLTGQNNSILPNYEVLNRNARAAGSQACRHEIEVETTTRDQFFLERNEKPSFFKIDVEGAELQVLHGMKGFFEGEKPPVLMVEVTAEAVEVWDFLRGFGFRFFTPMGQEILEVASFGGNVFCAMDSTHFENVS